MHPCSTGKRVRLTERDLVWLEALHRHGPLPTSFLLGFSSPLGMYEKRAKERLADLFHENNTKHGAPYLTRPPQQFQTLDARYNQIVSDLSSAAQKALHKEKTWSDRSGPQGGPWWHRLMISSITASVELATLVRGDVNFISQSQILERAETTLEYPVNISEPASKRETQKLLKPDALFGLEYVRGGRRQFRFFVLEADRATEPLTTSSSIRKSAQRSFAQYAQYVGTGAYKGHLRLTAPLLVLYVTKSEGRRDAMKKTLLETGAGGNNYSLFQSWSAFCHPPKIPQPNHSLLDGIWRRAGYPDMRIDR